MANIINNNFHNLKLIVNNDEYWDFFLNKDSFGYSLFSDNDMYDKCLISYIDAELKECIDGNWLYSTSKYYWENAKSIGYDLKNIGYTGLDNGLIPFRRDTITNRDFVNIYQNSTFNIKGDDLRLKLHAVSGGTRLYDYPLTVEENKIKLNGGFYQGFFETECDKYRVLPKDISEDETWEFEFVLNKTEFEKESNKTLNDKYPNNKGIFFYLGTRAENKWAYLYNKDDECFTLGVGDYVDGGDIDKSEYKIKAFVDANPDYIDDAELVMENYLTFNYYDEKEYKNECPTEDDFFGDDYLMLDEKPNLIDENKKHITIGWCCGNATSHYEIEKEEIHCCSCGKCKKVKTHSTIAKQSGSYLSGCDFFGDDFLSDVDTMDDGEFIALDLDISDFIWETDGGMKLSFNEYFIETDNKFLLFDRTCHGYTYHKWEEGIVARYFGTKSTFKDNLFLLMNRTCTGYTYHTIDQYRDTFKQEYNIYNDLYENALAFRITDSGAIGYRYCILDCEAENNISFIEGYSQDNIISENEWHVIHVKIDSSMNTMVMRFYVDGKLIFVTDEKPKLKLRELAEALEKQESVPFNISLGGGTQGLADAILPNYMLDPYRVYPLEENFAGTFIGFLKSFKFYNCSMEYLNISNNFKYEIKKLKKQ